MFIVIFIFSYLEKFECDTARGTRAEQHARNPRETQTRITGETRAKRRRAEPARTFTTSRTYNNSRCIVEIILIVVLIKLQLVEVVVIFIIISEFLQEI